MRIVKDHPGAVLRSSGLVAFIKTISALSERRRLGNHREVERRRTELWFEDLAERILFEATTIRDRCEQRRRIWDRRSAF